MSLRRLIAALALVLMPLTAAAQAPAEKVSRPGEYRGYAPALYNETVRTSVYLKVRDGTRLAMDLYRPAVNGKPVDTPYPVIWEHSLSRRSPPDVVNQSVTRRMSELSQYGYVVAYVERRGLGASFGARRGYNDRTEARDAYDVTEWLARQPWSSGKVGVFGCSNTGDAAMHAASYSPPSLKAVFAGCFSWSKYDGFLRGGIHAQWGVGPEQPIEAQLRNAAPVDGDDTRTLLAQAVEEHRNATPLAEMWRGMPFRDSWSDFTASRFWLEGGVSTYRDQLARGGAAYYIYGGWMDEFRREGLIAWANLSVPRAGQARPVPQGGPSSPAEPDLLLQKNPARIVIGPWLHCRSPGFDLLVDAHRFFDRWLKGVDNGIDREPPIHLYAQNAAQPWKTYTQWPPVASKATRLQLTPAARGDASGLTLTLDAAAPMASRVELIVRPAVRGVEAGSVTQPVSQAAQGLRFVSPPLAADTELTGHPLAELWIASPVRDQHVFVYLEDVAADGQVTVITEGRLKASLRAEHAAPYAYLGLPWQRSLEADHQPLGAEAVKLRFDLLPLSHVFKAGHRVRLVITGTDFRERAAAPAGHALTLISSTEQPSLIHLPLAAR